MTQQLPVVRQQFDKKLKWEWKIFQNEMMTQSRESLFGMAEIIAEKKQIYQVLRKQMFSEEEMNLLMSYSNMIDYLQIMLPDMVSPEEMLRQIKGLLCE